MLGGFQGLSTGIERKMVDDLKHKIPVSIGLIIWIACISFSLGALYTRVMDLNEKLIDEVGGLRTDWERDRLQQNERLNKLEDKWSRD